jgi:hypothetical protein
MPIRLLCPACGSRLRVADEAAGREVACRKCDHPLHVPELPNRPGDRYEPPAPPTLHDVSRGLHTPEGLGVAAMSLGFFSLAVMWIPLVGYLAFLASAVGLVAGCVGMYLAWDRGGELSATAPGSGATEFLGVGARHFPALGALVCLTALMLGLIPRLF